MRNMAVVLFAGLVAGPICALAAGTNAPQADAAAAVPQRVSQAVGTPQAQNFVLLAAQCAPSINIRTLGSLVRQESRANPFAINIDGAKALDHQPTTQAEAMVTAQALLTQGDNIDVGLGQINSRNFQWLGLSLAQLFDPCENLRAAAQVLSDCYARGVAASGQGQDALHAALSCYNTGSLSNGISNGYVRRVMAQATLPVPELLPLSQGGRVVAPAPLRDRRTAGPLAPQQRTTAAAGAIQSGEPDVFSTSGDDDAFSDKPEKEGGTINDQN
jgi:type IV secretion system protein VirB1